jgi:hypothetical protein
LIVPSDCTQGPEEADRQSGLRLRRSRDRWILDRLREQLRQERLAAVPSAAQSSRPPINARA